MEELQRRQLQRQQQHRQQQLAWRIRDSHIHAHVDCLHVSLTSAPALSRHWQKIEKEKKIIANFKSIAYLPCL